MTPEELKVLKDRIERIENILADLAYSDRFIFQKNIQVLDERGISFSGINGSRIGTSKNDKMGLWGVTPVVQPSSTGEASGVNEGAGVALTHTATFTGNFGTKAYTLSDVVKHLKTIGILLKT